MASVRDVAIKAGVSTATVSHVLNGTRPVSDALRRRVEAAAAELNYRPNFLARSLRLQKTKLIGVVIPDLYSSYFSGLLAAVESELGAAGYQILLCHTQESIERERKYMEMLSMQTDGLIIAPANAEETEQGLTAFQQRGIPVVFVDRKTAGDANIPYVTGQDEENARAVYQHLGSKYTHLAVISPVPAPSTIRQRIEGFLTSARRDGREVQTFFVPGEPPAVAGTRQMERILESVPLPVGVFCTTNAATRSAVALLKSAGVAIGNEVGLVGYDDSHWMLLTSPTISAVRTDPEIVGKHASKILLRMLAGEHATDRLETPGTLIVRASSMPHGSALGE